MADPKRKRRKKKGPADVMRPKYARLLRAVSENKPGHEYGIDDINGIRMLEQLEMIEFDVRTLTARMTDKGREWLRVHFRRSQRFLEYGFYP